MRRVAALFAVPITLVALLALLPHKGSAQNLPLSPPTAPLEKTQPPVLTPSAESSEEVGPDAPALFALTPEWQRCPTSYCETGWYASPALADLNEDGTPEVYWGGYSLLAVDGASGALLASVPSSGARLWPAMVATDLEGDGVGEIVVANGAGEVIVYGESLVRRLGWPRQPFGDDGEIRSLAVADLDDDGVKEIIVCSTRSENQWAVLEHNGILRSGWPRMSDSNENGYAAGCFNQNVAAGDIDGDGRNELVGPNDTHYVAAFEGNAAPVRANAIYGSVAGQNKPWARVGLHVDHAVDLRGYANCGVEHRPNMANSAPVIADLDSNGTLEVVLVGNVYNCGESPYLSLYEAPFVLKGDRTRWQASGLDWTAIPVPASDAAPLSEDYNRIEMNVPNPVLADLDSDGFPELLHTSYDGKLHAWSLDKMEHGNWPYDLQPAGEAYLRFGSEPVVADLNDDGTAEVILATWTENDSNAPGQLLILAFDGSLLQAIDLPWDAGDGRGGALGAPTLGNLDGDANLEVVVGTINRGLVAFEIADSASARVLWATGRGGFDRSGLATNTWQATRIAVAASVDRVLAAPGDALHYRVALSNTGSLATSVALTVTLPNAATLDSGSIDAAAGSVQHAGNQITWQADVAGRQATELTWRMTVAGDAPQPGALVTAIAAAQDGEALAEQRLVTLISPLQNMLPAVTR